MEDKAYTKKFKAIVDRVAKNNGHEISFKGKISANMVIDFVDAISKKSNINKINFESSSMDDEAFGLLLSGLADKSDGLKKLSSLSLHGNNISVLSNEEISKVIKKLPIKELSLMSSSIDNEMFESMSVSLRDSSTLRNVDLWGNKIDDAATRECVSLIKNPIHPLEEVNLHKNNCSSAMLNKLSYLAKYKQERKKSNQINQNNVRAIIARGETR